MSIQKTLEEHAGNAQETQCKNLFQSLIGEHQYVGELYSINYETANVMINDFHRNQVGGIPSLSFLTATRISPYIDESIDYTKEDSSVILLRVMDAAQLPQERENERIRTEVAQRVSGETDRNWDTEGVMDARTRNLLSFAAVRCRIVGTFYLDLSDDERPDSELILKFGCDISNYYPNKGLKVYKPSGNALETIVNYVDESVASEYRQRFGSTSRVKLGSIRYASTNRKYQQVDNVPVSIYPADLLSQKSALFGMTRTGKSNTAKIIAKAVYELRQPAGAVDGKSLRIGQIIFDPNGEYANENEQDTDGKGSKNALKNLWLRIDSMKAEAEALKSRFQSETDPLKKVELKKEIESLVHTEVVTYGILPHPKDPFRRLMKINFYEDDNLQIGKEIIDINLADQTAQYFKNFRQVAFYAPQEVDFEHEKEFQGQLRRYERRVLVYRALLKKAGFDPPSNTVRIKGFFNSELRSGMVNYTEKTYSRKQGMINAAGQTLGQETVSWDSLAPAFEGLFYFLSTADYNTFNQNYISNSTSRDEDGESTGEGWADAELESLLEMFKYSKSINLLGKVGVQHTVSVGSDYADDIYDDLKHGKLVIVDQSSGEPELNQSSAERIMWKIFRNNQAQFREGNSPTEMLIYLEEAHNLLPSGSDLDLKNVWVRTAKEGAKYRIGMVYSTQEVSSVQRNILKNTANWFIGHLNNTDETKELTKFYDFGDFVNSILRAQDKGLLRVKTLSNYFVIPVQVKKFDVSEGA